MLFRTGGPRSHCPNWWMHKPCAQLVQDVHLQWEQSSFGRGDSGPCGTSSRGPLSDMEGPKTAAGEGREADTALGAGPLETVNTGIRFPCDLFQDSVAPPRPKKAQLEFCGLFTI